MVADRGRAAIGWRVADAIFLLMFAFSVVVQVNDPDPLPWMAIYAAAAVASLLSLTGRLPWWFAVATGLVAAGWALTVAPRVVGQVPFLDMFAEFEMKDSGVEESREMYGLLLIAFWMAVIAHRAYWRRSDQRAASSDQKPAISEQR